MTLGIDLAAQPEKTAACTIRWGAGTGTVEVCCVGKLDGAPLVDDLLLELMTGGSGNPPAKVAIDAPFGWPVDFVKAMTEPLIFAAELNSSRRKRLERRATDHWVHEHAHKQPLSVTTDRIAYPAMRTAGLLAALAEQTGAAVDRTGSTGLVCETYPDPALRRFRLWPADAPDKSSYKGDAAAARAVRTGVVELLAEHLRMSDDAHDLCCASDDALDAVVCALAARAAHLKLTSGPPAEHLAEASSEGWIHLPDDGVDITALL